MRNTQAEYWLDGENVQWKYHPAIPLGSFDQAGSLTGQARLWANQIREEQVTKLAIALELAQVRSEPIPLPALICWQQVKHREHPWIISDGHHRYEAYKMSYQTRPNSKVPWEDETVDVYELLTSSPTVLEVLTRTANIVLNGVPPDAGEPVDQGICLVDGCGLTIRQAAAKCFIKEGTLSTALRTREVSKSLTAKGMKHKEANLGTGMMLLLHTIKLEDVRIRMAQVILKYKLTIGMAREVVDEIDGQGTEREKMKVIDNACRRSDFEERIAGAVDTGFKPKKPPRELMFTALRGLVKVVGPHRSLFEMQVRSDRDHKELGRLWGNAKTMMTDLIKRSRGNGSGHAASKDEAHTPAP